MLNQILIGLLSLANNSVLAYGTTRSVEALQKGLMSYDPVMQQRVLLEITRSGKAEQEAALGVLVDFLKRNDMLIGFRPFALSYFDGSDQAVLRQIIEQYDRDDVYGVNLLVVLARNGAGNDEVIRFLKSELEKEDLNERHEFCLRTALACSGLTIEENLYRLEAMLREGKTDFEGILMMALVGAESWMTNELGESLRRNVAAPWKVKSCDDICGHELDLSLASALVLSRVADKRNLQVLEDASRRAGNLTIEMPAIVYDFCAARLDKKRAKRAVGRALKYMSTGDHERSDFWGCLATGVVLDESLKEEIVKALYSGNRHLVTGSLYYSGLCFFQEFAACKAKVFELLESSSRKDTRIAACMPAAMMAGSEDIDFLKRLQRREKSEDVREELERALEIVRMEN